MKNYLKKNTITIVIVIATVLLAAIALFTAYRLYQTRSTAGTPASACHGANEKAWGDCTNAHFSAEAIEDSSITHTAWWEVQSTGREDGLNISLPWNGQAAITATPHIIFSNGIVWTGQTLTAHLPDNCEPTPCELLTFTITTTSTPTPTPTPPPPGEPAIDLEKHTNGQDADNPKGPQLIEGDDVKWEYIVTNTGDLALQDIEIIDNKEGTISCPQTTLDPDEHMTCTLHSTAQTNQYSNSATVTGYTASSTKVTDTDPSHYWGEGKEGTPTPQPTTTSTPTSPSAPTGTTPPVPETGTSLPTIIALSAAALLIIGALLLAL